MDYLYFPEDKTEYLSGSIWLLVAVIAAIVTMFLFIRYSKKELKRAEEFEAKLKANEKQKDNQKVDDM